MTSSNIYPIFKKKSSGSAVGPEQDGDIIFNLDEASGDALDFNRAARLLQLNGTPSFTQTSLRVDNSGNAIQYTADAHHIAGPADDEFIFDYSAGFTIECAVRVDTLQTTASFGSIGAALNSVDSPRNLWAMRFDNFDGDAAVRPCFVLTRDQYESPADYAGFRFIYGESRGPAALILGDTYHLLATIRPSNNTFEFWVNGSSQGSTALPALWHDDDGGDSVFGPLFIPTTVLCVGASDQLGGFGGDGDGSTTLDNVKIHLLEADDAFAKGQAAAIDYTAEYSGSVTAPVPDLSPSSGIAADPVLGLYSATTISARGYSGATETYDLGTTRTTDQQATRVGTEPFYIETYNQGTAFDMSYGACSAYTEVTIAPGEKKYIEFSTEQVISSGIGSVLTNMPVFGLAEVGLENPGVFPGGLSRGVGITNLAKYLGGIVRTALEIKIAKDDIVSMAVDYSQALFTTAIATIYVNGYEVSTLTMQQQAGSTIRPVVAMRNQDTGFEAKILTHQGVQTYAPPAGFTPLEV